MPKEITKRPLSRRALCVLVLTIVIGAGGCSGEEAVVSVGDVGYAESELLGVTIERRELLAALTGLVLAATRGHLDSVGAPFVEVREREETQLKLISEVSLDAAGIGNDVLEARYLANPQYELTVRHLIYLSDRFQVAANREAARSKAAAALERARGGEDFAALAAELSEEPGADRSEGLLPSAREGTWVPEFWTAASALEVGALSGVVESEFGFHVLRLEGREPIPFAEARDDVVEEVYGLLGDPSAWNEWAQARTAPVELRADALDAWLGGVAADDLPMASWPGGDLSKTEFDRTLAAQPGGAFRRLRSGDVARLQTAVAGVAREKVLVGAATEMGIGLSEEERDALRSEWRDMAGSWAATLGVQGGLGPEEIKAVALEALGSTRQGVMIAREEILSRGPLFAAAYPTRVGGPGS